MLTQLRTISVVLIENLGFETFFFLSGYFFSKEQNNPFVSLGF